jgi:predicted signal transduction protein with EAL and GGDEF domain
VELTETALTTEIARVLDSLRALSRLGVGASLDDFGTGFSSLQHLQQLPLTEIKIDRSFVSSMTSRREGESIVRAVVDMAGDLGLRVVAEGLDDDETRQRLLSAGCHIAQGWFYARPMPATEFAAWLVETRRTVRA